IVVVALNWTPPIAEMLPPVRRNTGAVVARVTPETPYSQQGRLQPGDVIYELNGKTITNVEDLKNAAAALKPSAAAVLLIERESTLMYLAFRVEREGSSPPIKDRDADRTRRRRLATPSLRSAAPRCPSRVFRGPGGGAAPRSSETEKCVRIG